MVGCRSLLPLSLLLLALATPGRAQSSGVKFSGYVQGREVYQDGVGLTASINRARLTASGAVSSAISWRIQGEFRTGSTGTGRASVALQDAFARWSNGAIGVQVGQFKTPFTREYLTSLTEVETADRSAVVDALAPKRVIGIMVDYARGGWASVAAGVFNGDGQNVVVNADSAVLGVARLAVRPIPFVVLGANVARYFSDSTRYGADVGVEMPWAVLRAEYVGQHHDLERGDEHGWYALVAVPARPWLQPVLRYERLDRPRAAAAAAQELRAWTAGVNFYPWGRVARLTLEYVRQMAGTPEVTNNRALAQAQVVF